MVGKQKLTVLAEALSDRDLALLRFLGFSRFATTRQLARFARHRHISWQSALRQTSRAMNALTGLKLTTKFQRRVGGKRAGSTGIVWVLTPMGRRLIDAAGAEAPARRHRPETEPSTTFLKHTLAITETHLTLKELDSAGQIELLGFEREPACWRRYLASTGATSVLKPDAFIIIGLSNFEDRYFLEIDCDSEALAVIVRKAIQYQTYQRSNTEQKTHGVFPAVLWITPTERRATKINQRLAHEEDIIPGLFSAISFEHFADSVLAGPIPP
ncbi:hypothetical protein BIU82_00245 [Arthrobacter sp. SW1]|uniref:replication-relaxation family protein n=1 Tax=Arthrobacter sp. SW1 TaxID=1920889 RepID=UPI000877DF78|nr:replication-relaxation family protein [Arthrobacter sp. SW1]OFI39547.1 hypothetical protein BIU82_00245 [Arthrobacter sp. SW1]